MGSLHANQTVTVSSAWCSGTVNASRGRERDREGGEMKGRERERKREREGGGMKGREREGE